MAKNRKANDALWMAIMQMLQGGDQNESAAVAASAMSDIQRDKADQGDIDNIVANTMFAQNNDPLAFMKSIFTQYPEMLDELESYIEKRNLPINSAEDLFQAIPMFLKEVRHYAEGGQFERGPEFVSVDIAGKTYNLLHLISEEEKERGLMDVEGMDDNEGALFDYSDEPQSEISFWMKNTSIPLDIIFINEQGIVISVKQGEPESEDLITESSEFVAYVIELNINSGVKQGDQTSLGETIEETDPDEDDSLEDEYPELNINHLVIYGSDGQPQGFLQGNERIFSRKSTRVIIRKAKRAYKSQSDTDYKALGRYVFKEMEAQDSRPAEYTE